MVERLHYKATREDEIFLPILRFLKDEIKVKDRSAYMEITTNRIFDFKLGDKWPLYDLKYISRDPPIFERQTDKLYKNPGGTPIYGLTMGSGLFEGPAKDYKMTQFREITLPLGGILVVTTL